MSATVVAPLRDRAVSPSWRRLLVPDFSFLIALMTLLTCLVLYDGTRMLFRDSDAGWHIRNGEAILCGSGLPHTDPYSFINNGQPWFAWEWLSDVVMGGVHQLGGPAAVAMLFALVLAACTWLWLRLTWAVGGDFMIAGAFALTTLASANIHWLARPHVFSWIFLLVSAWYVEVARKSLSWTRGLGIIAFGALWANIHASFFFGPVIAGVYGIGLLLRAVIWEVETGQSRARMLFGSALLATAGSFLNPYGWNLHRHVISYLRNDELLRNVSEFRSFDFHSDGAWVIVLCLTTAIVGAGFAFTQRNLSRALLISLLVGIAVRSTRGVPVVTLIALPLANSSIVIGLERLRGLRFSIRKKLDGFLQYSRNLRAFDTQFSGTVWMPLIVLAAFLCSQIPAVRVYSGFPARYHPVDAARVVENLPVNARILSSDQFGGYFIYRFDGHRKVYFDGRTDFYGLEQTKAYLDLLEVHPNWREQLKKFGFTHAVLPKDQALATALQLIGWREIYRDHLAVVLSRP